MTEEKLVAVQESTDLIIQLQNETDPDKLKDLTYLFNQNIVKRNILRVNEIQSLLDSTVQELNNQVSTGLINVSDLSRVLSVAEKSAEASMNFINNESSTPKIQINQINVQTDKSTPLDKLNRESRLKVLAAIDDLLGGNTLNDDIIDADVLEEELDEE